MHFNAIAVQQFTMMTKSDIVETEDLELMLASIGMNECSMKMIKIFSGTLASSMYFVSDIPTLKRIQVCKN